MAYEKILYSRFGFYVKLLDKADGVEIFRLLASSKLSREGREPEMYSHDRRILKGEINFSLERDNYNSVGLYKDDKLIGISFSSFDDEVQQPWLGYFYVSSKYRNSRAGLVLINYLMNHLYRDYIIQMGATDISKYGKIIQNIPILEYSVFRKGVKERFAKICDGDITGSEEAA